MPRKFELLRDETTYCRVIPKGDIFEQVPHKADIGANHSGDCFAIHFLESHPEFFREIKPRKVWVIEVPVMGAFIEVTADGVVVPIKSMRIEERDS